MTAPDKPTPGQIGLVETEIARWLWSLQRQPRLKGDPAITQGLCEQIALLIESGRFSVIGQGQEERDRKVFEAGYEAFCTKHYTLDQAWEAFAASADAAKKEGEK